MVRTLHFHGQGQAYDFWSGKWGHTSHVGWPKSKIKNKKNSHTHRSKEQNRDCQRQRNGEMAMIKGYQGSVVLNK